MSTEITSSPGPSEISKESLARDLKEIVGKTDHLLKDASHSLAAELSATRHAMSEKACGAASATHEYIQANPWKIVGMAVAAGAFIGAWIGRR